jgi:hypothetical protein
MMRAWLTTVRPTSTISPKHGHELAGEFGRDPDLLQELAKLTKRDLPGAAQLGREGVSQPDLLQ